MDLTAEELERYRRHLSLSEIGREGQQRLKAAAVLCVGAGGLGSPAALYLAAAGVGRIGIIDFDEVDVSNLQRQILHGAPDIGRAKVDSARDALTRLNPLVRIDTYRDALTADNALEVLSPYDIVLDGADNFATRYLLNDACGLLDKTYVYGGIFRFDGQLGMFRPARGPCYRCLYPDPPPSGIAPGCAEAGVVGALPGLIGSLQALEAIKLLVGAGRPLQDRLLLLDGLTLRFRELAVTRDPACPLCGDSPFIRRLADRAADYGPPPACSGEGRPSPSTSVEEISPRALKQRLDEGSAPLLIDVREPFEYEICRLPGAELIPLSQLPNRAAELDPSRETVVYCHVGIRSAAAVRYLQASGFNRVVNLAGGIDGWARSIDHGMPVY